VNGFPSAPRSAVSHGLPVQAQGAQGQGQEQGDERVRIAVEQARTFRVKQTLEVWISAPGFNTKVAQLRLKSGKIPTTVPLCVPPVATRPQSSCT